MAKPGEGWRIQPRALVCLAIREICAKPTDKMYNMTLWSDNSYIEVLHRLLCYRDWKGHSSLLQPASVHGFQRQLANNPRGNAPIRRTQYLRCPSPDPTATTTVKLLNSPMWISWVRLCWVFVCAVVAVVAAHQSHQQRDKWCAILR